MLRCELEDSPKSSESLIKLCDYSNVNATDMTEIREIISYLQLPSYQVQEGDYLSIYIVDNRAECVKGYLAVWHNRGIACINTDRLKLWGDWEESNKLVLSEFLEEGENRDGTVISGRRAYNTDGVKGIYSQGRFFRFTDYAQDFKTVPQPRLPTGTNISC
jgi:hypothetical protein